MTLIRSLNRPTWALCLVLLGGACRSASVIGPNLGEPMVLRVGDVAEFRDEGLRLGFTSVDEDSRCPPDVVCVWAGVAKVAGWAERLPGSRATFVLATSDSAPYSTQAAYENFSIELLNLSPRRSGMSPSDYRLTLVVRPK
jgi:hypothetical protein